LRPGPGLNIVAMSLESALLKPFFERLYKQYISKEPDRVGDKLVFRQPRGLVLSMFLTGLVFIPFAFTIDDKVPKEDQAKVLFGFIAFIIAAFVIGAAYAYYRFEVYDGGRILYRSMFFQKMDFYFMNVESLKVNDKGSIIMRLDNGRKARFNHFTTGEPVMYRLLEENVPEEKLVELKKAQPKKFSRS
jgi:hypothetical protein